MSDSGNWSPLWEGDFKLILCFWVGEGSYHRKEIELSLFWEELGAYVSAVG